MVRFFLLFPLFPLLGMEKELKRKNHVLVAKRSKQSLMQKKVEDKESAVDHMRERLELAEATVAAKDRALQQAARDHDKTVATLQEDLAAKRNELAALSAVKAELDQSRKDLNDADDMAADALRQVTAKTEALAALQADLDDAKAQLADVSASLADTTAQLQEAKAPARSATPITADFASLSKRPDLRRLYVYTNSGHDVARLVPVHTVIGNDLLTLDNMSVARLVLQHQGSLQAAAQHYSPVGAMSFEQLVTFAKAFEIVPALCTVEQLEEVFVAVNASEADDGQADTLDEEEFTELLARLAVLYMPGDFVFVTDPANVRANPDAGLAFQRLLLHMHANRPYDLKDTVAFDAKVKASVLSQGEDGERGAWRETEECRDSCMG